MIKNKEGRRCLTLCKRCHSKKVVRRGRRNKEKAVAYKGGGKCRFCGYNKCIAALEFHHKDPSKKDINFSTMKHWFFSRIKK